MIIIEFDEYFGPLKRAKEKGRAQFREYIEKYGPAEEIEKFVSLRDLERVAISTAYEIELCKGGRELSNPAF